MFEQHSGVFVIFLYDRSEQTCVCSFCMYNESISNANSVKLKTSSASDQMSKILISCVVYAADCGEGKV